MKASGTMNDYVVEQMNRLLTTLAFQIHRAAKKPGADEIHDLRVSIRRFTQGLLLFAEFFPKWEIKKIKRMLKRMMQLTSEIRNRDIALEYLAGLNASPHQRRLQRERMQYQRRFAEMVRRWSSRDFSAKWRNRLSLGTV
ncbi:MAG TPA: CHAD domain-containing protein [Bryobacteraceae bacterium]|nr:CHAD domain-containing protein [Bryobacteraceae bacterium]